METFYVPITRFYSCLDLIVLGSTLRILLLPGAGARCSFISCLFQEGPAEMSGHVQKVKGFVLVFVFWIDVFVFSLNMPPNVCVASPRIGTNTGVFSCE